MALPPDNSVSQNDFCRSLSFPATSAEGVGAQEEDAQARNLNRSMSNTF